MANWLLSNSSGRIKRVNNVFDLCEDPPKILTTKDLVDGRRDRNFTLLLGYEDVDLLNLDSVPGVKYENEILEDSTKIKILLVRDPFNFFASRLKMLRDMQEQGVRNPIQKIGWKGISRLWRTYAKEYLGETNLLGDRVNVNYNDWFSNRDYRDELCQRCLGTVNRDLSVQDVVEHGRGSSFDYTKFHGSAQKMAVLERWRYFKDDEFYLNLMRDEELVSLSNRIFGHISGTEEILK
ncbi:MAG: hypothetical protein WD940_02725 [Patescibacteria group bacterium]